MPPRREKRGSELHSLLEPSFGRKISHGQPVSRPKDAFNSERSSLPRSFLRSFYSLPYFAPSAYTSTASAVTVIC